MTTTEERIAWLEKKLRITTGELVQANDRIEVLEAALNVNELAAWLIALEDASMYEPVPASLVEHGRRYVHAGLTEKHSGDCTDQSHTCVVCSTSDAIAKAKQILAAIAPETTK